MIGKNNKTFGQYKPKAETPSSTENGTITPKAVDLVQRAAEALEGQTSEAIAAEPLIDLRQSPRRRMLKSISVVLEQEKSVFSATLRSISDIGATIIMGDTNQIPACFEIRSNDGQFDQLCEVVWRDQTTLGVKFI